MAPLIQPATGLYILFIVKDKNLPPEDRQMITPSSQQGIQDELSSHLYNTLELPGTTEERLNSSSSGSGYYTRSG